MSNSESSQKFKTGDTVQLKSGGPVMTVNIIDESGEIYCQWFTKDEDQVRMDHFLPDSLKLFAI